MHLLATSNILKLSSGVQHETSRAKGSQEGGLILAAAIVCKLLSAGKCHPCVRSHPVIDRMHVEDLHYLGCYRAQWKQHPRDFLRTHKSVLPVASRRKVEPLWKPQSLLVLVVGATSLLQRFVRAEGVRTPQNNPQLGFPQDAGLASPACCSHATHSPTPVRR
eukprot:724530-Prymnesium_polylepis.3